MSTLTDWQTKRRGRFTASSIYKLFVEPRTIKDKEAGKLSETAQTYIFELAVESLTGYRKHISSAAMEHGVVNEAEAFEEFCKFTGMNFELTSSTFFEIGENAGASPDGVLYDDNLNIISVLDVKCPYNPVSFYEQKLMLQGDVPKSYFYQMQMQMLATGAKDAYLARYLTNSFTDQYGNKKEFDLPIEQRLFITKLERDEKVLLDIQNKIDIAQELKDEYISKFIK
jgi:hypothetical protein